MRRKRNDTIILIISVAINMIILFLIPDLKVEEVVEKKLKVGLVNLQSKKHIQTKKQKKIEATKSSKKEIEKPQEKVAQKEMEKSSNKKSVDLLSLEKLSQGISRKPLEKITSKIPTPRESSIDIQQELLKDKNIVQVERVISNSLDDEIRVNDNLEEKAFIPGTVINEKDLIYDVDKTEEQFEFEVEQEGIKGLPSGYKLGVQDGDVVARWDDQNREPSYPESALKKGMQGKVLIRIKLDERGNVVNFAIEKGSGSPEINEAIEKVVRTWKIYLNKNGLNVKGDVTLEYTFKLLGNSN